MLLFTPSAIPAVSGEETGGCGGESVCCKAFSLSRAIEEEVESSGLETDISGLEAEELALEFILVVGLLQVSYLFFG